MGSALFTRPERLMGTIMKVQGGYVVYAVRPASETFNAGDLLRLTYPDGRYVLS